MTLQELLKNDEDKRSDRGGKSGERLADGGGIRWRRRLSAAAVTCSSRCRWQHSITVSVTGKTGQRHQTQISLLEWLLWKSITDSLAHLKNERDLFNLKPRIKVHTIQVFATREGRHRLRPLKVIEIEETKRAKIKISLRAYIGQILLGHLAAL